MDKSTARAAAKEAVEALSVRDRFAFSDAITEKVLDYIKELAPKSVFVYMSKRGEVSTVALISALFSQGIKVYIPKICGDDMLLTEITPETQLVLNRFGVAEAPAEGKELFADVNILPVVAFDSAGNRCGHGKGYYDRYLEKSTGVNIALAFSAQQVDFIECEPHDVKPKCVVTEKGIID